MNNDIAVYRPESAPDRSDPAAEATASTSLVVSGSLRLPTSVLRLRAGPKTVDYGRAARAGNAVTLERRGAHGRWIAIKRATTAASGLAAISWKPLKAGSYALRAIVAGRSATVTLIVK